VDQANERGTLVGAWRLASWENQAADGQATYPMGTDALGYLIYATDGRFSVTISRKGRAAFAAGDLLGGTIQEKAQAMENFLAYAGRYSFLATPSSTMWSCHCSPTGPGVIRSGGWSWSGTG
jgi:hypothetical protein